ncbi:MAG: sodium:solute symporter family protein [Desulfovibrionaceae bacterium]
MGVLDYLILAGYLLLLLGIGWRLRKTQSSVEEYFIGGRQAGTITLMALWMSSWIGGASIIGNAEQAYTSGMDSLWYPAAISFGCVVFALTFSGRIKAAGDTFRHVTYPDFLEGRYGARCRTMGTITTIFANIGYTAGQLLSAATILNVLSGWSTGFSLFLATAVTIFYTVLGGFKAMDHTSRLQAFIIFFGLLVFGLPSTLEAVGGFSQLQAQLPPAFLSTTSMPVSSILALFCSVGMTFYTSMDSYTRCFSAKSQSAARNGTLLAAGLVVGIGISVCIMGIAARVLFPALENGTNAFVMLMMHIFPPGGKGLMLIVILSAIMSTANSCILTASANLSHDIYHRFLRPQASQQHLVSVGRWCGLGVGLLGACIAYLMQDIIGLLCMAFTINSAGLFLPTLGAFFWKGGTPRAAFWSMGATLVTVLFFYSGKMAMSWKILPLSPWWQDLLRIDPLWPGLAASALLFGLLSLYDHCRPHSTINH